MGNVQEIFGSLVFGDSVMRQKLPKETYKSLKKTIAEGKDLDISVANIVATVMKDWAIDHGVTHYTHWFQPMTGFTAEKHDSFVSPLGDGNMIMEFSGKELIRGEPDASSFPSGGLRATFEARGYTAWDPTSYAFIKEGVLCIPTAFCSYGGESLDKKTPLLRSMEALNTQALRILRLFGNNSVKRVVTTVGAEQEYFLVRKEDFEKRKDLVYTGRTLVGAKPPKGQELDDHYFGSIKPKVKAFMNDLNEELWKLGIFSKTEHNEAAPSQHELAPVFTTTNIATDHNQITMEMMKKVAARHGLTCLLHEKPFAGVNGSGKHNNWSMSTTDGINLLEPGDTPHDNAQFLIFLSAVIAAVDNYQDLLRLSVASAGNDHRLGENEAPPAIVSMFLGDELSAVLESIESDSDYEKVGASEMEIGVHVLPKFPKDSTDRNRTSPFAFTGNKFEFRMLGSAVSIAEPNIIINTIVTDELAKFADILESSDDFTSAVGKLVKDTIKTHKRIIFNGNNYSDDWVREAEARGLLNLKTTADVLPYYISDKNIKLFERHKIFTEPEVRSRCEILYENYIKTLIIEGLTMLEMINKEIIPASEKYMHSIAETACRKKELSEHISTVTEKNILISLSTSTDNLYTKSLTLSNTLTNLQSIGDIVDAAAYCRDTLIPTMNEARIYADEIETQIDEQNLPYPTYGKLLFGV